MSYRVFLVYLDIGAGGIEEVLIRAETLAGAREKAEKFCQYGEIEEISEVPFDEDGIYNIWKG